MFIFTIFSCLWVAYGVNVGVANFFLGQSVGIDENNTFQIFFFHFFSSIKTVGATVLGGNCGR